MEGTITITGGTIDEPTFSSDLTFNNIYDVSAINGFIPDASDWNTSVYVPNKLIITRITSDGKMMNDE